MLMPTGARTLAKAPTAAAPAPEVPAAPIAAALAATSRCCSPASAPASVVAPGDRQPQVKVSAPHGNAVDNEVELLGESSDEPGLARNEAPNAHANWRDQAPIRLVLSAPQLAALAV